VFVWSVTPISLGVLNTTSGSSVVFTPTSVGSGSVSVAAYYSGSSAGAASAVVVTAAPPGPQLSYVRISPASASIIWGAEANFSAAAFASDGTNLTSQTSFSWSLDAPGHGSIRYTSGATESYLAPSSTVVDVVTVLATLSGVTGNASASVTVQPPAPDGNGTPGVAETNPWLEAHFGLPAWAWVIVGVVAVLLVGALLLGQRRARVVSTEREAPATEAAAEADDPWRNVIVVRGEEVLPPEPAPTDPAPGDRTDPPE
jgi:hypothetical protein